MSNILNDIFVLALLSEFFMECYDKSAKRSMSLVLWDLIHKWLIYVDKANLFSDDFFIISFEPSSGVAN